MILTAVFTGTKKIGNDKNMPELTAESSINTNNLFIMKNMYSETYKHFLVLYAVELDYYT